MKRWRQDASPCGAASQSEGRRACDEESSLCSQVVNNTHLSAHLGRVSSKDLMRIVRSETTSLHIFLSLTESPSVPQCLPFLSRKSQPRCPSSLTPAPSMAFHFALQGYSARVRRREWHKCGGRKDGYLAFGPSHVHTCVRRGVVISRTFVKDPC